MLQYMVRKWHGIRNTIMMIRHKTEIALCLYFVMIGNLFSCTNRTAEKDSTIDTIWQEQLDSLLTATLEKHKVASGKAIIIETTTGYIKTMVGLERKDTLSPFQPTDDFCTPLPTELSQVATILAALETGKVNYSDTIDVGNGIYITDRDTIKDGNWHRGGYGEISVERVIGANSRVGEAMIKNRAFGGRKSEYEAAMKKIGYGEPDSIKGIEHLPITNTDIQKIAPIQLITFYNAIANQGSMVQPQLYRDSVVVLNPQIATEANIDSVRQALERTVTEGLGMLAYTDKVKVAGRGGTTVLGNPTDSTYVMDFCGYFPADNPQYTVLVILQKQGLPASGNMFAAGLFRQIVDMILID